MAFATALLLLLLAAPAAHAVQYTVGDNSGWASGIDYTTWAQGKTFNVGDTLLFNYGGTHTVDEVSQSDYNDCDSGDALRTHTGGNTVITLSNSGPMYFICPTAGHCAGGMKLAINVVAAGGTSPSTPTIPAGPTTPSGTPSGGSTPSPPSSRPSENGAPSMVNYGFKLAFWSVLGAVLSIMR